MKKDWKYPSDSFFFLMLCFIGVFGFLGILYQWANT